MPLTTQLDVLCFTIDVLERVEIPYMVCGSMAAGALGEPRMTLDIDVVVQLSVSNAERLCAEFPSPEFYVSVAAARDAIRFGKQFNAIHPETGNKVDFMILGRDPWSRARSRRLLIKSRGHDHQQDAVLPRGAVRQTLAGFGGSVGSAGRSYRPGLHRALGYRVRGQRCLAGNRAAR